MTSPISTPPTFWEKIAATPSYEHSDDEPVIMYGKLVSPSYREIKTQMALFSTAPLPIFLDWLELPKKRGCALDLGCGVGANATLLLEKGWKVLCVDKNPAVIKTLTSKVSRYIESKRAIVREADITVCKVAKEGYDLVLCVDALPYIKPDKLQELMRKIFEAVKPGGVFIGSLFLSDSKEASATQQLSFQIGAHFYEKELGTELLTSVGFNILHYRERDPREGTFCVTEFIVQK
jgi:SAM-dependent methyltransferase